MGVDFITVRKYLLKQLNKLVIRIEEKNELFKERAAGAPFTAHAFTKGSQYVCRNYAVDARDATTSQFKRPIRRKNGIKQSRS